MLSEGLRDKLGMVYEEPTLQVAEEIEQSGAGAEPIIKHHHDFHKPKPKNNVEEYTTLASEPFDVEADEACFEDTAEAKMKSRITTKMIN